MKKFNQKFFSTLKYKIPKSNFTIQWQYQPDQSFMHPQRNLNSIKPGEIEIAKKLMKQSNLSIQQAIICGRIFAHNSLMQNEEFESILKIFVENSQQIQPQELKDCVWIAAKSTSKETLIALQNRIIDVASFLQDVPIIIWSYAKLQIGSEKLWKCLFQRVLEDDLNILDIANICWSVNQLQTNKEYLEKTMDHFERQLTQMIPKIQDTHTLATLVWSYSKASRGSDEMYVLFVKRFNYLMEQMNTQQFTNILWGLSKKEDNITQIINLEKVHSYIIQNYTLMTETEIVCLSWTLAKLGLDIQDLWTLIYEKLSQIIQQQGQDMSLSSICAMISTFQQLKITQKSDWIKVSKLIMLKKDEIQPNHMLTLVSCLDYINKNKEILKMFEEITLQKLQQFDAKTLSIIAQSFAQKEYKSDQFWNEISQNCSKIFDQFSDQGLIMIAWSYYKVNNIEGDFYVNFLKRIQQKFVTKIDVVNSTDLSLYIWICGRCQFKGLLDKEFIRLVDNKIIAMKLGQTEFQLIDVAQLLSGIQKQNEINQDNQFCNEAIQKLEQICSKNIKNFDEKNISLILTSKSILSENFYIKLCKFIIADLTKYTEIFLGNLLRSLGTSQIAQKIQFINILENEINSRIKDNQIQLQNISLFVKLFSNLKLGSLEFWKLCEMRIINLVMEQNISYFNQQDKINLRIVLSGFHNMKLINNKLLQALMPQVKLILQNQKIFIQSAYLNMSLFNIFLGKPENGLIVPKPISMGIFFPKNVPK